MADEIQLTSFSDKKSTVVMSTNENDDVNRGYENNAFSPESMKHNGEKGVPQIVVDTTTESTINGNAAVDDVENHTEAAPEDTDEGNAFTRTIIRVQNVSANFYAKYGKILWWVFYALLLAGYTAYFIYALQHSFNTEDDYRLLWVTCVVVFFVVVYIIKTKWGAQIEEKVIKPVEELVRRHFTIFKWVFIAMVIIGIIVFVSVDVIAKRPENMISSSGMVIYIVGLFIFSTAPQKVNWQPVFWGWGLQFLLGVLVVRTSWGYAAFEWLGERIKEFMEHTDEGSKFVFGASYQDHFFAFKVLPIIIFFSTIISVLYHLGIMQMVILKMSWIVQKTLGTTGGESVNATGNIFLGVNEAPLLIRPLLPDMTRSEIHAVMTGGYATISGSVMATYMMYGVPPNHLITASVMAAPCALAMSKLHCPETEESKQTATDISKSLASSNYNNAIEAAAAGATDAISIVASIAVNLIAFIAIITFFNATLQWLGARAGIQPPEYPPLTFQFLCSYMLWPVAFTMGVPPENCRSVAGLIGIKIFINEFVAYTELGKLIQNSDYFYRCYNHRYPDNYTYINDDLYLPVENITLVGGVLQDRSIVLSTYALCGFANISVIGIVIGSLTAMASERRADISNLAPRAMIVGNIVTFMNACTAGLLYVETPNDFSCP